MEFRRTCWNLSVRARSNWNLKVLVFKERGKPEYPEKNLSEQGGEPATNSTHIWHQCQDSNRGHISGRRVLSPLHHPCSRLLECPLIWTAFCFPSEFELQLSQFQACPSHPGICRAFFILSVPAVGICQKTSICPGVGHLSILLFSVNIFPYFTSKRAYLDSFK